MTNVVKIDFDRNTLYKKSLGYNKMEIVLDSDDINGFINYKYPEEIEQFFTLYWLCDAPIQGNKDIEEVRKLETKGGIPPQTYCIVDLNHLTRREMFVEDTDLEYYFNNGLLNYFKFYNETND